MKRMLSTLVLAIGFLAPLAQADTIYYDDGPSVRHHVYRDYYGPTYRRDVRVYRAEPDERYYYRDYNRPHYILPPGPHRIIQHILFGDPWE